MALPPFFGIQNRSMYGVPVQGGSAAMQSLRGIAQLAARLQTQSIPPTVAKVPKTRKAKLARNHR